MPAPEAAQMQQIARGKFMSFALRVPTGWQDPAGEAGDTYRNAFKPEELNTAPGSPPLYAPVTMNKYHTDTQKMLVAKTGAFIDGACSAICSAWGQWQSTASFAGIVVMGPVANVGVLVGPPLTPLIMASAPKASPMELAYSNAIAQAIGIGWLAFTLTVKFAATPLWPTFALFPSPVVPPTPNSPIPFKTLVQVPVSISADILKLAMVGMFAQPTAPFHQQIFESIAFAFEQCYQVWSASTQVTNVLGFGAVPTCLPPIMPPGPVIGTALMAPGGLV